MMKLASDLAIAVVRGYQILLSPLVGPSCRFLPTCSDYAIEALSRHGCWRGGILTVNRLCRCHPWAEAGLDPVPERCPPFRDRCRPSDAEATRT